MNVLIKSKDDIKRIKAYLQDAIIPITFIHFEQPLFLMHLNRFCWEKKGLFRTNSCIHVHHCGNVYYKNLGSRTTLNLLTISADSDFSIVFECSDHCQIHLAVEALHVQVSDIDAPWPANRYPTHFYELM